MFCGLVVGVEEIVVVRVAIKLEHLSYEFCGCVAFAQSDVLPRGGRGDDDALGMSTPMDKGTGHPYHQGCGGLPCFGLPCEVAVSFDDDAHGRSCLHIFLFSFLLIFMNNIICCVIGHVIGIGGVGGLLACWWRLVLDHLVMGVLQVSVACSFYVKKGSV